MPLSKDKLFSVLCHRSRAQKYIIFKLTLTLTPCHSVVMLFKSKRLNRRSQIIISSRLYLCKINSFDERNLKSDFNINLLVPLVVK